MQITGTMRTAFGQFFMPGMRCKRTKSSTFSNNYTVGMVSRHIFQRGGTGFPLTTTKPLRVWKHSSRCGIGIGPSSAANPINLNFNLADKNHAAM
jgi:hypothetical protein